MDDKQKALAAEAEWRKTVLDPHVKKNAATVALRVLLFPAMEERYYTWFFLIGAVALAVCVARSVGRSTSWFVVPERSVS